MLHTYNIHTYIHTHEIQGYIGHSTTNLHLPIDVTDLGTMRDVIPVRQNAPWNKVRRELLAANDTDKVINILIDTRSWELQSYSRFILTLYRTFIHKLQKLQIITSYCFDESTLSVDFGFIKWIMEPWFCSVTFVFLVSFSKIAPIPTNWNHPY